jgi:hypothetical protein
MFHDSPGRLGWDFRQRATGGGRLPLRTEAEAGRRPVLENTTGGMREAGEAHASPC